MSESGKTETTFNLPGLCAVMVTLAAAVSCAAARSNDQPCSAPSYACAATLVEKRNFDKAIPVLRQLLRSAPKDLKARNLLAVALAGAGREQDAITELSRVLELNPIFYPALKNLALNELHAQRTVQAKEHLEQAVKLNPKDESVHLLLADVLFDEKQYAPASEHYRKAIALVGRNTEATLRYAQCELRQGNSERAMVILEGLPPKDGEAHFRAGAMLVEEKAFAAAARQFDLARPNCKDPYLAGYNQTLAYVKAGEYVAAIRTANELLNEGHQTAELANVAATAYLKNNQPREAYSALRLATSIDPKDEDAYVELCNISLDQEKVDVGLEIADVGLAHLPGSERIYVQRGVLRAMKGQFPLAEQDFSTAARLAPEDVLPDVALGLVSMQTGHIDQAVAGLRRAAQRHPDNYLAQYWLSKALQHDGAVPGTPQGEDALAALQASVRSNPDFWHAHADLGKILLDFGQVDAAIEQLQKAAELNPSSTTPLYLLARAYHRKGDEERAGELTLRVSKMQAEEREREVFPRNALRRIVREGTLGSPSSGTAP